MSAHTESRIVEAPRDHVFALIADVEKYPEFLPMWNEARVYRHRGDTYYTEQEIGLGPICRRFRTRTVLSPPDRIDVTSTDRVFRGFHIRWNLAVVGRGCRITVTLDWQVRSWLMQRAIDLLIPDTARAMVVAFENRARTIAARGA